MTNITNQVENGVYIINNPSPYQQVDRFFYFRVAGMMQNSGFNAMVLLKNRIDELLKKWE